uniref:Uncharacterized protein n=1 Tax=Ciona intestinalis TaxID=7719 RepID=H2Y1Q8_CIOIN
MFDRVNVSHFTLATKHNCLNTLKGPGVCLVLDTQIAAVRPLGVFLTDIIYRKF